jgi:hypothetical protein
MINGYGAVCGMRIGRGNRSTRRKRDPVPLGIEPGAHSGRIITLMIFLRYARFVQMTIKVIITFAAHEYVYLKFVFHTVFSLSQMRTRMNLGSSEM